MKTTEKLLRAAVANPNLKSVELDNRIKPKFFDVYRVELPLPDFSGVPTDWIFAVQNRATSKVEGIDRGSILSDVFSFLSEIPKSERVVLVSDDPGAHLGDEFDSDKRDVFCLDSLEFTVKEDHFAQPRLAPFMGSVRRKVYSNPMFALLYSPYQRAKPVSGWRFFGRKKQIDQIVGTDENYVIVGPRRVGKTSLMRGAYRRLQENGEQAFFIDVQNCYSAGEVANEILHHISQRDLVKSLKHHEVLGETVLSNVLRRMTSGRNRTTLFLDELGNVITNLPRENWSFLGVLRKFSQTGRLRFVISCFQEYFLRQQQEFTGPLINFANTMRLRVFTRKEVEDFVLAPLRFWRTHPDSLLEREERALVDMVMSRVGSHPYLLQYFSFALFQRVAEIERSEGMAAGRKKLELAQQANALFHANLIECFETAVDELFLRIPSPLLQYLFLRRCKDAEMNNQRLDQVEFNDSWLQSALSDLGFQATFQGLRTLLEALEMHSLCTPVTDLDKRMFVAAPVVYYYVQKAVPSIDVILAKLAQDVRKGPELYGLTPIH